MKRYLMIVLALTVILALLPLSNAAAQLKWEAGVKGGVSMANLYGSDVDNTSIKYGAAGGAFVTAQITEMFGVQLEGLYMQKGAKYDDTDSTGAAITGKLKLDYIEIPLLAVASFKAAEKVMINVYAGPALGILASAKDEDVDIKDYVKSTDFGATFGAGFTYDVETVKIVVEGRYTLGLVKIDDTDAKEDIKNGNFAIMGGFSIPFGSSE
jgi:hypothetical protein